MDSFKTRSECHQSIRSDGLWCLFLIFASIFGAIKSFKLASRIMHFIDIRNFYHEALGISSDNLDHLSWMEILKKEMFYIIYVILRCRNRLKNKLKAT